MIYNKFKIGYRTIKTALGATLAIALAQVLGLDSFTSAGIITILCIKATKKTSLTAAGSRILASFIAMGYSALFFEIFGYHALAIGIILLLFIPTTVAFKVNEGIANSCVIILHFYSAGGVSIHLLVNETFLIMIGVGVALVMNLYMPSVEHKLKAYQQKIEANFSKILMEIVKYVRDNDYTWDGKELTETSKWLAEAKSLAFRDVENHFLREENYYYRYFDMREKQFEIIERILPLVTNIPSIVKQSDMLADFIRELAENVHPQNTAFIYLDQLKEVENSFKEMKLPETEKGIRIESGLTSANEGNRKILTAQTFFQSKQPKNEKTDVGLN